MKRKSVFSILITMLLFITIFCNKTFAENTNLLPTASNNISVSLIKTSSLVPLNSGYMRVYYNKKANNIGVEYYDDSFNITKKTTVKMELSIYGGFYAGSDGYYVVEGQNNTEESDNKEIIRVIKYDTNWKKINHSSIKANSRNSYVWDEASQVRYPFDYGCVEMTESNGKLYIVTGHEGYIDPSVGQGHQGFFMIEVDEKTFAGKIIDADLWHSFAQYIDNKDEYLYVLEQSEGDYCTLLTRYDKNNYENEKRVKILTYGGNRTSSLAVACYSSVNGIALSNNNVLSIGTSIDQSKYGTAYNLPYNIYLGVSPINDISKSTVKWLTNYSTNGKNFTGLELVKINDNKFLVIWEEYQEEKAIIDNDTLSTYVTHYQFIDGNGNKVGKEYSVQGSMSDCKPIVKNNKVVYFSSSSNMVNFYTIDLDGKFNTVRYRVAGENATWSLKNGTLTISGKGSIDIDAKASTKNALSDTFSSVTYESDNSWKPIRESVNKIVIEEGITSIPDLEFKFFSKVTSVKLPDSMKTLGKDSFGRCNFREIYISKNVTSIGEDAFWNGFYYSNDGEKYYAYLTIYTPKGSYAEKYAKTNGIRYMNVGWYQENGNWYYKDNSGVMSKSCWEFIDGKWYYFRSSGIMVSNDWREIDGKWYYFENSGSMISNGWGFIKNKWYYFNGNGVMQSNCWCFDREKWYYLDGNGVMVTNSWKLDKGKWYYLDGSGVMLTNCWSYIKNKWYRFNGSGVMLSNCWSLDKGKWYYLNNSGAMVTNNWVLDKGKWYYFDGSGVMLSNCWRLINKEWYYFQDSGAIITNDWLRDYKGDDYYFNQDGKMVSNKKNYKIGDKYYNFDSNGRCTV